MNLPFAALLASCYLAMIGSARPGDALAALAFGSAIALVLRAELPRSPQLKPRVVMALIRFLVGLARELAVGSWTMLRVLLGAKAWQTCGTIEVPFGERSERAAVVSALAASAAPGSVAIDIDTNRRVLSANFVDAADPGARRAELERFYRRYQRALVP